MSSHCSRYPGCGCNSYCGTKCHLLDGDPRLKEKEPDIEYSAITEINIAVSKAVTEIIKELKSKPKKSFSERLAEKMAEKNQRKNY